MVRGGDDLLADGRQAAASLADVYRAGGGSGDGRRGREDAQVVVYTHGETSWGLLSGGCGACAAWAIDGERPAEFLGGSPLTRIAGVVGSAAGSRPTAGGESVVSWAGT